MGSESKLCEVLLPKKERTGLGFDEVQCQTLVQLHVLWVRANAWMPQAWDWVKFIRNGHTIVMGCNNRLLAVTQMANLHHTGLCY